jgi:hypothetical protein
VPVVEEIDPGRCVGVGGLNQIEELNTRRLGPYMNFKCTGHGYNVEMELCVENLGYFNAGPAHREGCLTYELGEIVNKSHFGLIARAIECTVGVWYRLWVWYWEPGMSRGDIGVGKSEVCNPDIAEKTHAIIEAGAPIGPEK